MPPQLSRGANVSTEDTARWSTAASTSAANAAKKGPAAAEKKKADSWNAKEKRKRSEGKTSREGSFVEEEKRLLRQAGAN
jgi:hypothetical protein